MSVEDATIIELLCKAYNHLSPVIIDKDGNEAKKNLLSAINESISQAQTISPAMQNNEPL